MQQAAELSRIGDGGGQLTLPGGVVCAVVFVYHARKFLPDDPFGQGTKWRRIVPTNFVVG